MYAASNVNTINEGVCYKVVRVLSDLLSRRMSEGITKLTGNPVTISSP